MQNGIEHCRRYLATTARTVAVLREFEILH
jgi:hypothetical protein